MNTIIPQAWIIEERVRREEERRRIESEGNSLPISLPERPDFEGEYFDPDSSENKSTGTPHSRVIIIDI